MELDKLFASQVWPCMKVYNKWGLF